MKIDVNNTKLEPLHHPWKEPIFVSHSKTTTPARVQKKAAKKAALATRSCRSMRFSAALHKRTLESIRMFQGKPAPLAYSNGDLSSNEKHNKAQSRLRSTQRELFLIFERVLMTKFGYRCAHVQTAPNARRSGLIYEKEPVLQAVNQYMGFTMYILKECISEERLQDVWKSFGLFEHRSVCLETDEDREDAIINCSPLDWEHNTANDELQRRSAVLSLLKPEYHNLLAGVETFQMSPPPSPDFKFEVRI